MININDSVVVKNGVKDPNFPKYDIGGYQGRVVNTENQCLVIDLDSITLRSMPEDYMASCFLFGADFGTV
ncbi:hypothetical protein DA717_14860, partial [Piscirickettsiaceae bacterium NZ-RLO2]